MAEQEILEREEATKSELIAKLNVEKAEKNKLNQRVAEME